MPESAVNLALSIFTSLWPTSFDITIWSGMVLLKFDQTDDFLDQILPHCWTPSVLKNMIMQKLSLI